MRRGNISSTRGATTAAVPPLPHSSSSPPQVVTQCTVINQGDIMIDILVLEMQAKSAWCRLGLITTHAKYWAIL